MIKPSDVLTIKSIKNNASIGLKSLIDSSLIKYYTLAEIESKDGLLINVSTAIKNAISENYTGARSLYTIIDLDGILNEIVKEYSEFWHVDIVERDNKETYYLQFKAKL
jgi:hypothetical protein